MSYLNAMQPIVTRVIEVGRRHLWLWLAPTAIVFIGATAYALTKPAIWRASQAIVVRDEASGNEAGNGQFHSIDTMKTFQETVLEVARNRIVVAGALKSLGPPPQRGGTDWPSSEDIQKLQKQITVTAPNSVELKSSTFRSAVAPETQPLLEPEPSVTSWNDTWVNCANHVPLV